MSIEQGRFVDEPLEIIWSGSSGHCTDQMVDKNLRIVAKGWSQRSHSCGPHSCLKLHFGTRWLSISSGIFLYLSFSLLCAKVSSVDQHMHVDTIAR